MADDATTQAFDPNAPYSPVSAATATPTLAATATPEAAPTNTGQAFDPTAPYEPVQSYWDTHGTMTRGLLEGAGQTVGTVGHLLRKIPGIQNHISEEGLAALDKLSTSGGTTGETIGQGAEMAAEWAIPGLAEESGPLKAAKLVALAKKYPLLAETMNLATKHPWLAKLIMSVPEGAATGAAVGAAHAKPGETGQGAKTGAVTGAIAGPAAELVNTGMAAIPPNPFRAAVGAVKKAFTTPDVQPALKSGIKDIWDSVAERAGVAKPTTQSVRDMGHEVGDAIYARSKATYKMIDEATGNRFSGLERDLRNVNQKLRFVTDDIEENALNVRKQRLEMQTDQMMDEAQTKGVSAEHIKAAKADFKQAQAIYDTSSAMRKSVVGVRPGMTGSEAMPEQVNAKPMIKKLGDLYDKGRLQEAVGEDAPALIGHLANTTAAGEKAAAKVAGRKEIAKSVGMGVVKGLGIGAGAAGAGALGAKAVEHFRQAE
jgi:hypothetical protein